MGYVLLDDRILSSTLWLDRTAREVFITALLMARPFVLDDPAAQLQVRSIAPTGWTVPPGSYGFVAAAGPGIVQHAAVPMEEGLAALERLCSPDSESRSRDFDGRRMARIDGGYVVLNFAKYRRTDRTNAARQARHRSKHEPLRNGVTSRYITQAVSSKQLEDLPASRDAGGGFPPSGQKRRAPNPDVKALVDHFSAEYERQYHSKPVISGATAKAAQALLAGRDLADAKRIVSEFLDNPPTWYADRGLLDLRHIAQAANTILARGAN